MNTALVVLIEQYLPSIILIIIGLYLGNQDKKRTHNMELQQTRMTEWFKKVAKCITANNDGTLALAVAIQSGETNGKLTAAMEEIKTANEAFSAYIDNLAFDTLAKR